MLVDRIEEGRHCKINVKDGHIVQRNFYLNALDMERI
jgi:ketosteroid isomerase-like protein